MPPLSQSPTPDSVMRDVTTQIIRRAIKLGRRKGREIRISKTAKGMGSPVADLNPDTPEGRARLDAFLSGGGRHYTIAGLGAPEDPNAINWRDLNLPFGRKMLLLVLVGISFFMRGSPLKNKLYRVMGVHIGRNTEIMQMAWLDHFRPELIFIGDNTLIGAFSRATVHAYDGCGTFRYGLIEIGSHCTIGAGTGIGPILMEDNVRTLPGTTLSPYLARIRSGSVVGYVPPPVKREEGSGAAAPQPLAGRG